uniref:ADP-ribosylation factor-like protein 6 n=1 Tax=Bicosoecida sp. CB-2014 TaxID=1486930 RepID=A0A7S1CCX3_9STRA|mmetsp:Transcript_20413/g.72201  ORF Transcript_20413/g.72201 Transcript_20413/m.72201 type:complete len:188 (+) Transcript_20413:452-1015(+)
MGLFKRLAQALGLSKRECKILVVGLDNSGKTTLINRLKPKKSSSYEVVPTVGFSVESFSKNGLAFTAFDMSGQGRYRSLWETYYADVQAIIYVLDSTDKVRMCVAKDELDHMLAHKAIKEARVPVLFFANKMDKPSALTPAECMEELGLSALTDKAWHIAASCAVTGEGVEEGIEWLANHVGKADRK